MVDEVFGNYRPGDVWPYSQNKKDSQYFLAVSRMTGTIETIREQFFDRIPYVHSHWYFIPFHLEGSHFVGLVYHKSESTLHLCDSMSTGAKLKKISQSLIDVSGGMVKKVTVHSFAKLQSTEKSSNSCGLLSVRISGVLLEQKFIDSDVHLPLKGYLSEKRKKISDNIVENLSKGHNSTDLWEKAHKGDIPRDDLRLHPM